MADSRRIAVVGVCAAGKTTLVRALQAQGWHARQVLQEHSYVPHMWQRITNPDVLIYLDALLETVRRRRRDPEFPDWLYAEEQARLRHARAQCDFYVDTNALTPEEVLAQVTGWLEEQGARYSS
jgi:chloramphenicol 3-O-phosphotransferase